MGVKSQPEGWKRTTLGSVADFVNGDRSENYPTQADRVASGIPFINTGHIEASGRLTTSGMDYITRTSFERLKSGKVKPGDIVYCLRGSTIGKTARNHYVEGAIASSLVIVRAKADTCQNYLYYFLTSSLGQELVAQHDNGSAQPNLSVRALSGYPMPLPPIDEQRAIAHILGTLDDKIELNRRMNETLEAMARALFKSWFVDFDPVRAKAEGRDPGLPKPLADLFPDSFEDSELGEIPKEWEVRSLYETAAFIKGAAFKSEDFCEPGFGLPIVKIAELKDGISAQTKFSFRVLDPNQLIDTGELLYSWSGSPDTSLDAFLWTRERGLLNQHIFKVETPTIAEKRFVYYLLKFLKPTLVEIARNKQTTGLGHVTIADMKRLHVCSPPLKVLKAFDNHVAPFFDRAFKNTIQSQTVAALRDALLPKLTSGELRVKDTKKFGSSIRSPE